MSMAKCYGGIAQLVRALASHARGRRFESYCLYHAKGTRFRVPFAWQRRTRTTRAEREGKRGRKQIARRSCEGEARRLAEGAPQGFRQIPTVSTTQKAPVFGCLLRGREGREPRALRGKEKEEENKSRVVRARAKPGALVSRQAHVPSSLLRQIRTFPYNLSKE